MSGNVKIDVKCVKGNVTYFKSKIDSIIKYEMDKLSVKELSYQKLNSKISDNFIKFTDTIISGGEFNETMINLRDEVIIECIEVDKSSSFKMRPFLKDYIFDKIYTMGINIKKGILPDDLEQELEEVKLKMEEENKNEEQHENELAVITQDVAEEKPKDIVDLMWGYFFGSSQTSNPKAEKSTEKNKTNYKDKIKGE